MGDNESADVKAVGWAGTTARAEGDRPEKAVKGGFQGLFFEETEFASEAHRSEAERLARWWIVTATGDLSAVVPKAIQYGGADLEVMAKAMEALIPAKRKETLDRDSLRRLAMDMAIGFYALGKVARLFGAYEQGELPSEDTWFDLGIYAMIARRVREEGAWVHVGA